MRRTTPMTAHASGRSAVRSRASGTGRTNAMTSNTRDEKVRAIIEASEFVAATPASQSQCRRHRLAKTEMPSERSRRSTLHSPLLRQRLHLCLLRPPSGLCPPGSIQPRQRLPLAKLRRARPHLGQPIIRRHLPNVNLHVARLARQLCRDTASQASACDSVCDHKLIQLVTITSIMQHRPLRHSAVAERSGLALQTIDERHVPSRAHAESALRSVIR